jgi:hypothetical protein
VCFRVLVRAEQVSAQTAESQSQADADNFDKVKQLHAQRYVLFYAFERTLNCGRGAGRNLWRHFLTEISIHSQIETPRRRYSILK